MKPHLLTIAAALAMIGCAGCSSWDDAYGPDYGYYYYTPPLAPPHGYLGWHVDPSMVGRPLPPPHPIPDRPVMNRPNKPGNTPPTAAAPSKPPTSSTKPNPPSSVTPSNPVSRPPVQSTNRPSVGNASNLNRPQTTPGATRPGNNGYN